MTDFAPVTAVHSDGTVAFGSDEKLWVKFFAHPVHLAFKSQQEGRPVYESRDYVEIMQPGEPQSVWRGQVTEEHRQRFPRKWDAYQAKREQTQEGTPLPTLFPAEPHFVSVMHDLKIFTVEQLAALTEHGISRLGLGGRDHVQRAQRLLEASKGMAGAHRMQAEIDAEKAKVAVLESEMAQLRALLNERTEPSRKRA